MKVKKFNIVHKIKHQVLHYKIVLGNYKSKEKTSKLSY